MKVSCRSSLLTSSSSSSCSAVARLASCLLVIIVLATASCCHAKVYFKEDFNDKESLNSNWVYSKHEAADKTYDKFELTAGKYYGDKEFDQGIKTTTDYRFYAISSKFADNKFDNLDKDLIFQFSVKHEQNIDCGGGYMKLFGCDLDQEQLHGDTQYKIMFGPDICGPANKKVQVIFNYKGKNLLTHKDIRCKDDEFTHLYRLHVKPDNTYKVSIDGEVVESGELEADWDFLAPKKIKDPEAKKPADWVDEAMIDDPEDKKPDAWDVPELIPDPEAKKPDDWDEEIDGEWMPSKITNPEYKGEWKPKKIDNPKYKGAWVHPEIDNPEYAADSKLYHQGEICAVGIDVWQVKSGTIFDNILITDDEVEADKYAEPVIKKTIPGEKEMKKAQDAEEEKKAAEAAEASKATEAADDSSNKIDDDEDDGLKDADEEASKKDEAREDL